MASRLVSACQCYHFRESQCCHVVSLNETWLESPQSPPAGKTPWNSSRSWGPNPRIPLRSKHATCNEFPNSGAKSPNLWPGQKEKHTIDWMTGMFIDDDFWPFNDDFRLGMIDEHTMRVHMRSKWIWIYCDMCFVECIPGAHTRKEKTMVQEHHITSRYVKSK